MDLKTPPFYDPIGQWTARSERSDLRHPDMAWTAFDRYDRYSAVVAAVRRILGPGCHRVLDVGDSVGYLASFDPELDVTCVDPRPEPGELPGAVLVAGQGEALPFADCAFAAVVSVDALEHVPPAQRPVFLDELARVADQLLVVACPFDTPGVAVSEELVRRYAMHVQCEPQQQLDEHAEHGLPSLTAVVDQLRSVSLDVWVEGNGNLVDWLTLMLLKFRLETGGLRGVGIGLDLVYNGAPRSVGSGPFYRHVVTASRTPLDGERRDLPAATAADLTTIWVLMSAIASGEVVRRDLRDAFVALHGDAVGIHDLVSESRSTSHGDALGIYERLGVVHEDLRNETRAVSRRVEALEKRLDQLGQGVELVGDEVAQSRQALHGINTYITHVRTATQHPLRALFSRFKRSRHA